MREKVSNYLQAYAKVFVQIIPVPLKRLSVKTVEAQFIKLIVCYVLWGKRTKEAEIHETGTILLSDTGSPIQ